VDFALFLKASEFGPGFRTSNPFFPPHSSEVRVLCLSLSYKDSTDPPRFLSPVVAVSPASGGIFAGPHQTRFGPGRFLFLPHYSPASHLVLPRASLRLTRKPITRPGQFVLPPFSLWSIAMFNCYSDPC